MERFPLSAVGRKDKDIPGRDARISCPNEEYFDYRCGNKVGADNIVSPWFCSEAYKNQAASEYPYCKNLGTNEPMID